MRTVLFLLFIITSTPTSSFGQDVPKPVKTEKIHQAPPEKTGLYSVEENGVVRIDWDTVQTLATSKADRTLSPIAEVMIAIRDNTLKPLR